MFSWLWNRRRRSTCARRSRLKARPRVSLALESLEARLTPAIFVVTSFLQTDAVNLSTGDDGSGHITLRSAIEAANHLGGTNTINLSAGTYSLVSHFLASGNLVDLTIANNLTIAGAGPNVTSIDSGGLGRVLQIANNCNVTISGVWIANGLATDRGGAIDNAGNLTLSNDILFFNRVLAGAGDAFGGAIYNESTASLTLTANTQLNNSAVRGGDGAAGVDGAAATSSGQVGGIGTAGSNGGNAYGGAIYNNGGAVNITGGLLNNNTATGGDGGRGGDGGPGWNNAGGADTTQPSMGGAGASAGSGGQALGGAIFNNGGTLTISNCTIAGTAQGGSGAEGGAGGDGGSAGSTASGGGRGGNGASAGAGGRGAGGAIYNSTAGTVTIQNGSLNVISGNARGGAGAFGGIGGQGGAGGTSGSSGAAGGNAGSAGVGGPALGGALFNDTGSVTITGGSWDGSTLGGIGGRGANGGIGGAGGSAGATSGIGGNGGNGTAGAPAGASAGGALCNFSGTLNVSIASISGRAGQPSLASGNGGRGGKGGDGIATDPASIGGNGGLGGNGGAGPLAAGGGIYSAGGALAVANSTFSQTVIFGGQGGAGGAAGSGGFGGGLGGATTASTAGGIGGFAQGAAIAVFGGAAAISGSVFFASSAFGGTGGAGGAGAVRGATGVSVGAGQTGGSAGDGGNALGGALDVAGGTATVTNCTFGNDIANGGNAATGGAGGQGGAGGGSIGVSMLGNGGPGGTGGSGLGGAVHSSGGLNLINVTISANQVGPGTGGPGGLGASAAANNGPTGATGNARGGGAPADAGTLKLLNTVIAANTSAAGNPDVYGAFTSQGFNLIGNGAGGAGFVVTDQIGSTATPIDAKLSPLQDNGGPTMTAALLAGSPAIGHGTAGQNAPTIDQRGAPRDSAPDIGAFEVQPFVLNPGTLPAATAGNAYNQTLTVSGGTGTVTLTVSNVVGSIPGLPLPASHATSLTISGTPTGIGVVTFDVVATDGAGARAGFSYVLTVNAGISISPAVLTSGLANVAYNQTITASGGTGDKSLAVTNLSGAIPGLDVPITGTNVLALTGTPTASGTVTFTVTATDGVGASASQNYSLTINGPLTLNPGSLANAIVGAPYSRTIAATGGIGARTMTVSNVSGTVPGITIPTGGAESILIAGTPTGTGTTSFTVTATDGAGSTSVQSYTLLANQVSLSLSLVMVAPASMQAGGTATVTLTTKDASGNPENSGGLSVAFALGNGAATGMLGNVTDHGDGTYTATFTAGTVVGSNTFTATIGGQTVTSTPASMNVTAASVSTSLSTVAIAPTSIAAGGTTTVTLTAKDTLGNPFTGGGLTVAFSLGAGLATGTFGAVTDNQNGTYTATFTSAGSVGTNAILATIGGQNVTSTAPTLTVTPGAVSLSQSTISVTPSSMSSGATATVKLIAKDAFGNQLTGGGLAVVFSLGAGAASGAFSTVTDNNNGAYTATFTAGATTGSNTITAKIGGQNVTSVAPTVAVTAPPSLSRSVVSVSPATITTTGTATVTLTAKSASGIQLTGGGLGIAFTLGAGSAGGTFGAITDNQNGTYTATFTPTAVGSNTFKATIGGQILTSTAPTITVTLPTVTLTAPTGAITSLLPTFTWSAVVGANHYDIWVDDTTANVSQVQRNQNINGTTVTATKVLTAGHAYRWWVRAIATNGSAGSWGTASLFNVTALPTPVQLTPDPSIQTALPVFSWNGVTGADSYDVWVDDLTTKKSQILRNQNVHGTSSTATKYLTPGDRYQWWVRSVNQSGNASPWGSGAIFTVTPLATPAAGVSPTGSIPSLLPTFSWNQVAGADFYDLWIDDSTAGQSQVIRNTQVDGTSFTAPTPLVTGHSYKWWVRSLSNTGNQSPWGNGFSFTIAPLGAPALNNFAPTIVQTLTPTFTWSAVAGASSYDLWADDLTSVKAEVLRNTQITGTTWTPLTPLTPGHKYTWWVRSVNANSTSSWPSGATFTASSSLTPIASSGTLPVVAGLAITNPGVLPTYNWTTANNAAYYDLWVNDKTANQAEIVRTQTTSTSVASVRPLIPGHSYQWWVRAIAGSGAASGWGAGATFTAALLAKPTLAGPSGSVSAGTLLLTWNAVTSADSYDVWIDDTTSRQAQVVRTKVVGLSVTPELLTVGHSYQWWVRALSTSGNSSDWSTPLSFTLT